MKASAALSTIAVAAILWMLTGCAGIPKPVIPAGCENSLIYKYVPYPEVTDLAVKLAVFEIAKHKPEIKPILVAGLNELADMMENDSALTYGQFVAAVASRVSWVKEHAGTELIIVSEVLAKFDQPIPITACDRELFLDHLGKQLIYLNMIE